MPLFYPTIEFKFQNSMDNDSTDYGSMHYGSMQTCKMCYHKARMDKKSTAQEQDLYTEEGGNSPHRS